MQRVAHVCTAVGPLVEVPMLIMSIVLISCLFLSTCETIKGVGRDVEDTGEAIDDAIDDE